MRSGRVRVRRAPAPSTRIRSTNSAHRINSVIIPSARRRSSRERRVAAAVIARLRGRRGDRRRDRRVALSSASASRSRHYDARGHLVVARRIIDSITPGWQQIGAVWLPLPHLLERDSGADRRSSTAPARRRSRSRSPRSRSPTGAIASIVLTLTGSARAAVAGAAVFALNPNVLYLQSTPMTEPLLLATDDGARWRC